jgi:hypothetical protein
MNVAEVIRKHFRAEVDFYPFDESASFYDYRVKEARIYPKANPEERIRIEIDRHAKVCDGGLEKLNPETGLWEYAGNAETKEDVEKELKRLDDEYCGYYQAVILDAVESEKDAWEYERECRITYRDLNRRAGTGIR